MACSETWTATISEEEQKEQRLIDVMFLCDEWKSSKGGLSTFNREFAINLAQATTDSMKIHCYASKSDEQDREDARQHGVNLITARSIPGSTDSIECLKFPPSELPNPQLVIGHGRKLGSPAYSLVQNTKCKWIQFVHVYCEDLGKYKKTTMAVTDTIEENEKKHKMEIELCKAADAVVAVGSRLQQKYSRSLLNVKVEIITPGIFEKFSNESRLAVDRTVVKDFTVFMFGRAAFEDLSLKGYDIIANAIGSLGKEFKLTFVGSSPGEHQKVEQWFLEKTCVTRNQLTIRGYCSKQEELKMMFYQSDLVSLPSRTEGFGLVALEAISAGVPVLVSGESGIAEALQKVEGGQSVVVESDDDATQWAQRIKELSSQSPEERQTNAMKLRENYRKVYSWRTECERFKGVIKNVVKTSNDGKLNVNVDVEDLKPADANMHGTASENAGCQRTTTAVGTCRKWRSDTEIDDLQALKEKALCLIAINYLQTTPPQSGEEHKKFMVYLEKMRVVISGVSVGSLVVTVKCDSLKSLEELWEDYSCGRLEKMVQDCFVTEKILKELNLTELKLKTTMDEEEYSACRAHFDKAALRAFPSSIFSTVDHGEEALASRSHLVRSVIESWQRLGELKEQEQKKEIVQPVKVKGTSHSAASFTSGSERIVGDLFELMKLQEEGEYQLLPDFRREITSPFAVISTTDLIDEDEGVLETRRTKKEKSGLDTLLTSHIRKGEWQVVLEYLDGLPRFVHSLPSLADAQDDERIGLPLCYSSESGTLNWWPTDEDHDLVILCKAISQSSPPLKITRLILSGGPISDEGVKNLSLALSRSDLNRLTLDYSSLSQQGIKYLSKAIAYRNCKKLTSLTVSGNHFGDRGITHICEALTSNNCELTRLDLRVNSLGNEGMKLLSEAITSGNCKLMFLDVSYNHVGNEGIKHLCFALTSSASKLTSLNVRHCRVDDKGIEYLFNALTDTDCKLGNLDLRGNSSITVEGRKHLCDALTGSDWKIEGLKFFRSTTK